MKRFAFLEFPLVVFLLSLVLLAVFGDLLWTSKDIVLSDPRHDLANGLAAYRQFGFEELAKGNLALWNPHICSGLSFFGEMPSALLYPLNFVFLIFPLSKAININIILHVFLMGIAMYIWCRYHKLHPLAGFLCSVLAMFSGPFFLHITAGHLPNLCAMAWVPFILLAVDGILKRGSNGWCLAGVFFVAMQILSGQPQYFFYTAVTAGLYFLVQIISQDKKVIKSTIFISMFAGAFLLTAVQILASVHTSGQSIRQAGVPFGFAAMLSFPPENFLTLLVPNFFGDDLSFPYWGRWYIWETSLFITITGFFLAIYGWLCGDKNKNRIPALLILLLLILALGKHTPLFKLFYDWVPGFNLFRGSAKFIFPASLFFIFLAGVGLDSIIKSQNINRKIVWGILGAGLLLFAGAFWLEYFDKTPLGFLSDFIRFVYETEESYAPRRDLTSALFFKQAGIFASKAILFAGMISLILFLTLFTKSRFIPYLLVLIAVVEIFVFAMQARPVFELGSIFPPELKEFARSHPGDERIFYQENYSIAMPLRLQNIWGYDQLIPRRYAEFIGFTQGADPDLVNPYVYFSNYNHPFWKLVRYRYVFGRQGDAIKFSEIEGGVSRVFLVNNWELVSGRNNIFQKLQEPGFDPLKTVILEKTPAILPVQTAQKGEVSILDSSSDHITIKAHLTDPAILVVSDNYDTGWKVKDLSKNKSTQKYEVLAADYILRAVPLSKGEHFIRMEYLPFAFQIGKWITFASCIFYFILIAQYLRRKRKENPPG